MAGKKVLIFAPYGAWMVHHQLDAVIGAALAHRGCEVMVVLCDGFLQSCLIAGKPPSPDFCRACAFTGEKVFSSMGVKIVQLRSLATDEDREIAAAFSQSADPARMGEVRYERYPLGKWCPPSLQGYFATADFPLGQEWAVKAIRDQFSNGVLLVRTLNRLMDRFRPDQVFSYNSTHYYYRIASELGKERGLPVLVHERGHLNDSFTLLDGESTNANQGRFEAYKAWEDVPLTEAECLEVRDYFREREEGKNGFSQFYSFNSQAEGVRRTLRIPEGAPILALFGSGDRELGAFETVQRKTFSGQLDWIRATAEICRKRGWYLVIRHHPSNVMKNLVNFPFITGLAELNREMPDCVRVVMPHEKLTSYAILWNADGAVTHFSTMGSETPTRGVVGVCVGDSLYQPLGVEWAGSREDYENALVSSVEKTRNFGLAHLRRAYRGAHYVVFKLGYKFKSFGIRDVFAPEIRVTSLAEFDRGKDPILDRVCDYVMEGKPLLPVPGPSDKGRDDGEERAFLEGELRDVQARRRAVKAASRAEGPSGGPLLTVLIAGGGDPSGIRGKSLARSREKSLERIEVGFDPSGDYAGLFGSLRTEAERARGRYLYIALPGVDVNESVFSDSIDFLEREGNRQVPGISWGAWLGGPDGKLTGELFTEARPCQSFEDAIAALPSMADPMVQFPFIVMRKEFFSDLIGWLEAMAGFDPRQIAATLFNLIHVPKAEGTFHRMSVPMIAIYPEAPPAPNETTAKEPAMKIPSAHSPHATPQAKADKAPDPAILTVSPEELKARLEKAATAFSANPSDLEAGLDCADLLARLGEGEGSRRVLRALQQRHPDEPRIKPMLDGVDWKARQGLAGVVEWGLRGRGYQDLREKRTLDSYADAKPYVESVPGWMLDGQEQYLFDKVKSLPDGAVILEMGADRGRSTSAMALACKGTNKRIFSIDTFAGNDGIMGKTYDFYHEWHGNLARLGVDQYVTGVQGYTFDVLPAWNTKIDFAFIDASHEYIDVLNDFSLTYPHVKEGGWIAFHDVESGWPGPWRVWLDFGIPMLVQHQTVANLACGRKAVTMPLRRDFKDGVAFSFARHWIAELKASWDPQARALSAELQCGMDSRPGERQSMDRAREAERSVKAMPDYLKTNLRNMILKDAFLDGWLHYWQGLVLEAENKGPEADKEFREALKVSYPASRHLVEPHLRGAEPSKPQPIRAEAWFSSRLAGSRVVLEYGSREGTLLRELPGESKIGIEPDVGLCKRASLEAGIDAVNRAADLPDACADAIVCDRALERDPAPLRTLASLLPKLKPGGMAFFTVSALHGAKPAASPSSSPSLYAWTQDTLRNLFTAAGFAVADTGFAAADGSAASNGSAEFITITAGPAVDRPASAAKGPDWAMVPAAIGGSNAVSKGLDPRDIPVALVAYNRPEHTRQVLRALSDRGIRNLHIFLDGAKGNGDEQSVRETRKLAESVDWIRPEIHTVDRNRGLAKSIVAAADLLFSEHEHMVLLEDDCVPQKHCFDFMAKALDKYRDDEKVFGISGYSVPMTPDLLARYPYDAYFCPRIGSWGWATWKRAWRLMETDILTACRKALDKGVDLDQGGNDIRPSLEGLLQGTVKDVWTLNWVLTVYLHGGQFLYPMVSHIDNIGMDGTGVHCGKTDRYQTVLAQAPATRFPDRIATDPGVIARFRSFYDQPAYQRAGA
ncbi:MAG: glycosyltransferase and protein [Fibrobacteres bacterium]|nr:glycosyltransferase and protein [Fibrobacterota bacterium]